VARLAKEGREVGRRLLNLSVAPIDLISVIECGFGRSARTAGHRAV